MKSGIAILLAGLMVAGVVAAIPAAAAVGGIADGDHVGSVGLDSVANSEDDAANESNETRPGERLGGVIGVQAAEIEGEVESRSFERRTAADRSDDERADAVEDRLRNAERRLDEIEDRQAELRERRDQGNISEGEFRARTARLAAETTTIERSMNRSAEVAAELPHEVREPRGIDNETIRTIRNRTAELSGPEVAKMAHEIAGPNVGGPVGPSERPDHAGRPAMNETPSGPTAMNETPSGPQANISDRSPNDPGGNASDTEPGADDNGPESSRSDDARSGTDDGSSSNTAPENDGKDRDSGSSGGSDAQRGGSSDPGANPSD